MLSKVHHFVEKETLRSINFGIFSSNITYGCQVWGQIKTKAFNRLESLQNKAIKVIHFANRRESVTPLYKAASILKIKDFIRMQNFLYAHDDINENLPHALRGQFNLVATSHNYMTRNSVNNKVLLPSVRTTVYGIKSIRFQSVREWNFLLNISSQTS